MPFDLFEPLIMASHLETKVKERYASAAHQTEAALCCPVQYDKSLLEVIPAEVIEKDYGCGDPRSIYAKVKLFWIWAVAQERFVSWQLRKWGRMERSSAWT